MSKIRFPVAVTFEDQAQLEQWESAHGTPQQVALRCRILLGAIDGQKNQVIANRLNLSRPTVNLWRKRARDLGIGQVWEIAPGRGRKAHYDQACRDAIINATLQTKPKGETHWSCRSMAREKNISKDTVNRLWQMHTLKPHLSQTFKLSRDTKFLEKMTTSDPMSPDDPVTSSFGMRMGGLGWGWYASGVLLGACPDNVSCCRFRFNPNSGVVW